MSDKLIELLARQGTYPLDLAHEIGIEGAIAVNEIIKLYGLQKGARDGIQFQFKKAGIKDPLDMVAYLSSKGIIEYDAFTIQIQESYFHELDDFDLNVEIKPSIWQDKEFLALLARWKAILTSKAIRKSEKDFALMFEGKDHNSVKRALQYSIDNRLSTLFYSENNRGHTKADSLNRGGGANRGAGEGASGESKGGSQTPRAVHKGIESLE